MPLFEQGFPPERVVVVSKAPRAGQFLTIQAAIDFAVATLSPTATNPVLVLVAPGTYVENVLMNTDVYVASMAAFIGTSSVTPTILSGTLGWIPPAGAAVAIQTGIVGFRVTGAVTLTMTTSISTFATFAAILCRFNSTLTATGRTSATDIFSAYLMDVGGAGTYNSYLATFRCCFMGALTFGGNTNATLSGACLTTNVTMTAASTAVATMNSGRATGTVTANAGTTFNGLGAKINAVAGAGGVNRDYIRGLLNPSVVGANAIVFGTPFMDANYRVCVTQRAGVAAVAMANGEAAGGFNIACLGVGDQYDWIAIHD